MWFTYNSNYWHNSFHDLEIEKFIHHSSPNSGIVFFYLYTILAQIYFIIYISLLLLKTIV
jgi:hypothetical protein